MKHKSLYLILMLTSLGLTSCSNEALPSKVTWNISSPSSTSIHTKEQNEFLNSKDPINWVTTHLDSLGSSSSSFPAPISITFKAKGDTKKKPTSYLLDLYEGETHFLYESDINQFDIYNLKVDTEYKYIITAKYDELTSFSSEIASFKTDKELVRNLKVEGVENFRDLGGMTTSLGKIKQNKLFRSSEFNGKNGYAPTIEGLRVLNEELHIKSDIDLRRTLDSFNKDEIGSITSSPLGENVNLVSFPLNFGGMNIFTQLVNKETIKYFFEFLANESNYPAVFHCVRGTDRTGALAYLLGAILGLNEDQLIKEYLFSDFAKIGTPVEFSNIENMYVKEVNESEGDTLKDKATNYLIKTVDLSKDTINRIQEIMIEK